MNDIVNEGVVMRDAEKYKVWLSVCEGRISSAQHSKDSEQTSNLLHHQLTFNNCYRVLLLSEYYERRNTKYISKLHQSYNHNYHSWDPHRIHKDNFKTNNTEQQNVTSPRISRRKGQSPPRISQRCIHHLLRRQHFHLPICIASHLTTTINGLHHETLIQREQDMARNQEGCQGPS